MFTTNPEKSNPNPNPNRTDRMYNPYADLDSAAQKLYRLPSEPEYLFHEESIRQRRSWGENLTYYTGCGYLSGAVTGGAKGFITGARSIERTDTVKLRVNRMLNSVGSNGGKWGNRVGSIGLMYAGIESGIVWYRDTDDIVNSVAAGLATGVLFRAGSGPRAAAVAGAAGGVLVGVLVGAKQVLKRYVPI